MTATVPKMNPLQPAIDEMLRAMRVGSDALLSADAVRPSSTPPAIPSFSRPDADDERLGEIQVQALRDGDKS